MTTQFHRFNQEKLDSLRARYRGDDLFRAWTTTLCNIENQFDELNAVEVWSETEEIRQELCNIQDYRDNEIPFLLGKLMKRHQSWINEDGSTTKRTSSEGERTALFVLIVLFSQLVDAAADSSDEAIAKNPNHALCNALAKVLTMPKYQNNLTLILKLFKSNKTDNSGNKIVLPIVDYMNIKSPLELMDVETKQKTECLAKEISFKTQRLKKYLKISWEAYCNIWLEICSLPEMMILFENKLPNSDLNNWGKNWKLIANILGIMKNANVLVGSNLEICNLLEGNLRPYISKHKDFGSSNTALNKNQHNKIEKLIEKVLN